MLSQSSQYVVLQRHRAKCGFGFWCAYRIVKLGGLDDIDKTLVEVNVLPFKPTLFARAQARGCGEGDVQLPLDAGAGEAHVLIVCDWLTGGELACAVRDGLQALLPGLRCRLVTDHQSDRDDGGGASLGQPVSSTNWKPWYESSAP